MWNRLDSGGGGPRAVRVPVRRKEIGREGPIPWDPRALTGLKNVLRRLRALGRSSAALFKSNLRQGDLTNRRIK